MANISFKSITFPGLANKYKVPEISNDLMTAGKAADAKATGDALSALEDQFDEETDKLKADLGAVDTKIYTKIDAKIGDTGWQKIVFTPDSFIDLSKTTADVSQMTTPAYGFSCAVVPCSAGDKFLLNLTGGGRSRAWGFVSSNGNVISVADANTTVSDYTLIAPANSAYLVLHNNSGSESYIKGETVVEMIESRVGLTVEAINAAQADIDDAKTDLGNITNDLSSVSSDLQSLQNKFGALIDADEGRY